MMWGFYCIFSLVRPAPVFSGLLVRVGNTTMGFSIWVYEYWVPLTSIAAPQEPLLAKRLPLQLA